jgi:hypothetical protein
MSLLLYQGTASAVPQKSPKKIGLQPLSLCSLCRVSGTTVEASALRPGKSGAKGEGLSPGSFCFCSKARVGSSRETRIDFAFVSGHGFQPCRKGPKTEWASAPETFVFVSLYSLSHHHKWPSRSESRGAMRRASDPRLLFAQMSVKPTSRPEPLNERRLRYGIPLVCSVLTIRVGTMVDSVFLCRHHLLNGRSRRYGTSELCSKAMGNPTQTT